MPIRSKKFVIWSVFGGVNGCRSVFSGFLGKKVDLANGKRKEEKGRWRCFDNAVFRVGKAFVVVLEWFWWDLVEVFGCSCLVEEGWERRRLRGSERSWGQLGERGGPVVCFDEFWWFFGHFWWSFHGPMSGLVVLWKGTVRGGQMNWNGSRNN